MVNGYCIFNFVYLYALGIPVDAFQLMNKYGCILSSRQRGPLYSHRVLWSESGNFV